VDGNTQLKIRKSFLGKVTAKKGDYNSGWLGIFHRRKENTQQSKFQFQLYALVQPAILSDNERLTHTSSAKFYNSSRPYYCNYNYYQYKSTPLSYIEVGGVVAVHLLRKTPPTDEPFENR